MENQKPLTGTQIELIRLVMKQVPEDQAIREMQGIIARFQTRSTTGSRPAKNGQA